MMELFQGARFAGLLLAGAGLLLVLLAGPTALVPPAIWGGPPTVSLPLIAEHAVVWRAANIGFVLATVLTAAGLFLVPPLVGDRGYSTAWAAAVVFLLATGPWLVTLAIRLALSPGAADEFVRAGTVDPAFIPLDQLGGALFSAFMLIASASLVILGAAIVAGGALAAPLGWACIVAGAVFGGGYLVLGDMLPAFVYLPTTALGIALLLAGS